MCLKRYFYKKIYPTCYPLDTTIPTTIPPEPYPEPYNIALHPPINTTLPITQTLSPPYKQHGATITP